MADGAAIGVLAPNLFVRAAVDAAVLGAGARPIAINAGEKPRTSGIKVVIIDLEALGERTAEIVAAFSAARVTVLAFAPHVATEILRTARAGGAIALPRQAFLARLPELLAIATRPGRSGRPGLVEDP